MPDTPPDVPPDREPPVLVGCAHGTRDPAGRRTMARLRLDVAALRPGLEVRAASVDVQRPGLDEVVRRLAGTGRPAVVVPLLLSAGYHMAVDVAEAVRQGQALGGRVVAAPALGPDPALVEVLADRLADLGGDEGADGADEGEVLLVAAGSSDPRAVADVEQVAAGLAERVGAPVRTAYLSAARPGLDEALAGPGTPGLRVACYLLAEGFFDDRLRRRAAACGVRGVTAPLAPHPLLAELVLRRYDEAVQQLRAEPVDAAGGVVGGAL